MFKECALLYSEWSTELEIRFDPVGNFFLNQTTWSDTVDMSESWSLCKSQEQKNLPGKEKAGLSCAYIL